MVTLMFSPEPMVAFATLIFTNKQIQLATWYNYTPHEKKVKGGAT